jgi:SOS-response transcriptional repressor LexA
MGFSIAIPPYLSRFSGHQPGTAFWIFTVVLTTDIYSIGFFLIFVKRVYGENMKYSEKIGQVCRQLGAKSYADLEKILDLSNGYLANLEKKGTDNPGKLLVVLTAHGISADWFLTGKGEMLLSSKEAEPEGEEFIEPDTSKMPLLKPQISMSEGEVWDDPSNIESYINPYDLSPSPKGDYLCAYKMAGNSMIGMGICDGDYVIFTEKKPEQYQDGIYVVALDGVVACRELEFDSFVKRIKVYSIRETELERAELNLIIPDQSPMAQRLKILGKVVSWVHPNPKW